MREGRIALVAALEDELSALPLKNVREVRAGAVRIREGTLSDVPVLTCAAGIGPDATRAALGALTRFPLRGVVALGYAGGLSPGLDEGAVVVSRQVRAARRAELSADPALEAAAGTGLRAANRPYVSGACLTLERVALTPGEKFVLGTEHAALVADLESYWLAVEAMTLGLPWLVVRAVIDPVHRRLPSFVTARGRRAFDWVRPALHFVMSERRAVADLLQLSLAARKATRALGAALPALLPPLSASLVNA